MIAKQIRICIVQLLGFASRNNNGEEIFRILLVALCSYHRVRLVKTLLRPFDSETTTPIALVLPGYVV